MITAACLLGLVPILVNHYLSAPNFSPRYRKRSVLGGVLWLGLGLGLNELVFNALGIPRADSWGHYVTGLELAQYMKAGDWDYIWSHGLSSNPGFQVLVGLLHFFTGMGLIGMETLTCFLGFWGCLILTRHFANILPQNTLAPQSLFFVTFLPSAIFWTSSLIKEAFIFWGICLFYSSLMPSGQTDRFKLRLQAVIGFAAGIILRPYTMMAWVCAVGAVVTYKSRRIIVSLAVIAGFFVAAGLFRDQLKVESIEEARAFGESMSRTTLSLQGEGAESSIMGPQIFFVSGAISLFFRPFPWNIRAIRLVVSSAEIWIISLLIIVGWKRATRTERRLMVRRPDIMVSVLVCMAFSILFTYMVNEGQVARARLQAMPALLTLAYVPLLLRYTRKVEQARMKMGGPVRVR